tara:strand:+ start:2693 stop:3664 length:972 start_codon:yes stop_codon:yes gene_type:complete
MFILKLLKFFLIFIFSYIIVCISIYTISGFLLISGIKPKFELIKHYQRNFYFYGGLRNIWQSKKECIDFDEDTIFIPKKSSCNFKNLEFDTTISFDKYGRYSEHILKNGPGVAVLGDSHAMGWGVNDHETFSAKLEKKINRPVYNLGVSGYGTLRELIRFEKSGLIEMVDTVVIQYCYNDWGENNNFKKNSFEEAKKKFDLIGNSKPMSTLKKLRKIFRYSITIPIDIITDKNQLMDFDHHNKVLQEIIQSASILKDKKIVVIYANGFNMKFKNFPNEQSKKIKNLYYQDLNLGEEHFYQIDGHLTAYGHNYIAEKLNEFLSN